MGFKHIRYGPTAMMANLLASGVLMVLLVLPAQAAGPSRPLARNA